MLFATTEILLALSTLVYFHLCIYVQVHEFLVEKLGMSEGLVDTLCEFADAQGMLLTTTEGEVAFKPHYARKMLAAAVELYRWHRMRTSALKAMFLQTHQPSTGMRDDVFLGPVQRNTSLG